MSKYVLNPKYGDMSVVVLGSSIKTIKKKLANHWEDVLKFPEEYDEESVKNIKHILDKEYVNIEELKEDYDTLIDEDYMFEESY